MLKRTALYLLIALIFFSCASTGGSSRLGTGKPKFASLEQDGISYFLSSEDGTFSRHRPLKLIFRIKNESGLRKVFNTENNVFLVVNVRNEIRQNLFTLNINAERFLGGSSFALDHLQERVFEITLDTQDTPVVEYSSIYCQVRLFFLPRQFRRTALSIHLDRK